MAESQALQQTGDGAPAEMSTREFSRKEVELLKRTIAQDATDTELSMFIQNCKRYGLDPFTGQIHAVKRWDSNAGREVMSVQVGIDGFRLIADRTGKWTGTKGPYWCDKDGEWTDVWLKDSNPAAAKVGVLRSDFSEPRWGIARWDAYVATKKGGDPTFMWRKMPAHMLAKCAEALALRSAFPNDLSGLYTDAEMDQAGDQDKRTYDGPDPDQVQDVEAEVVNNGQDGKPDQWYKQATDWLIDTVKDGEAEASDVLANADSVPSEHPIDDWPDDYAEAATEHIKNAATDSGKANGGTSTSESSATSEQDAASEQSQKEDSPSSDPEQVKEAAESVEVEGEDANDEAFEDGDGLPF
jgi:phage recombination protein Bet